MSNITARTPFSSGNNYLISPLTIGNCSLWLDAADSSSYTTNGNTLTAWRDKSGNNNNITISGTVTYSNSNVTCSNSYFYAPVDARRTTTANYNIFIVYNQFNNTSPTTQALWGNDIGGGWNRFQLLNYTGLNYNLSAGYNAGAQVTYPINAINNLNRLIYHNSCSLSNTNGSFVYVNGSNAQTYTEYADQFTTTTTNTYFATIDTTLKGNVNFNEIVIFRRSISTTERQQIEGYLAWKWGLRASLPTTHPYYNNPYLSNSYPIPYYPAKLNPTSVVPTVPNYTVPIRIVQYLFSPRSINNCTLWLDGADSVSITQTNGSISQWNDKSGSNNHAVQATSSNQPTLSGSNISFNGTSSFLTLQTPSILPSGSTVNGSYFFVTRNNVNAVGVFFMYGPTTMVNGANPQFYYGGSSQYVVDTYGAGGLSDSVSILNTTAIQSVTLSNSGANTVVSAWRTGTAFTGGTTTTTTVALTSQYASIGVSATTTVTNRQFYYSGIINEIVIYNSVLTISQRQQIEGYLAWKWGLQKSLPVNHPYILFPP